ncbi:hypothetical protein GOQ29_03860 [Clostridium sp. D2Q-14]|uniref:hypothetical protein n=1 Tax=Anaeromonas gelatinilytica TaxID=2683194 RepID=UPI00193B2863|nr:hypothetical protein [Anaeromonas gelatinilytica]MBS4534748.1 hypothetical protein [Anaeromonas gelatinilytica]
MKTDKFLKLILYFFNICIIVLLAAFIVNKQYSYILNLIFIYVVYIIIINYEKRKVIDISNLVKFLFVLISISHLALGQYFNFYETGTYFDKALHLIGIFGISLFSYEVLISVFDEYINSKILISVFVFSIGITLGNLFEIFEFILDVILNKSNQHGLVDINLDLIFNSIGAFIAGIWIYIKY